MTSESRDVSELLGIDAGARAHSWPSVRVDAVFTWAARALRALPVRSAGDLAAEGPPEPGSRRAVSPPP